MSAIHTHSLTKYFGRFKAVDTVSITVEKGEVYGFLGLNGAGKTTTIRMMLGMAKSSKGHVTILDQTVKEGVGPWGKVGYMVETPAAYPNLSVVENLKVICHLRGLKVQDIDRIVELLNLGRYRNTPAKNLSLGNKQRLGLAKALMHDPEVILLDEPANGLDPMGIVEVRKLIRHLALEQHKAIIVSSHQLAEVARTATRIGIIHEGRMIQELNNAELDAMRQKELVLDTADNSRATTLLKAKKFQPKQDVYGHILLTDESAIAKPDRIARLLVEEGLPPRQLQTREEDLENYFMRTIQSAAKDEK